MVDGERRRKADGEPHHRSEQCGANRGGCHRVGRHIGRRDHRRATGAKRCIDTKFVDGGLEVRLLREQLVPASIVSGKLIDTHLQRLDGALQFFAGGDQLLHCLLATHGDVRAGVAVGQHRGRRRIGVTHRQTDDIGSLDRRASYSWRQDIEPEVGLHPLADLLTSDHLELGLHHSLAHGLTRRRRRLEQAARRTRLHQHIDGGHVHGGLRQRHAERGARRQHHRRHHEQLPPNHHLPVVAKRRVGSGDFHEVRLYPSTAAGSGAAPVHAGMSPSDVIFRPPSDDVTVRPMIHASRRSVW